MFVMQECHGERAEAGVTSVVCDMFRTECRIEQKCNSPSCQYWTWK